MILDANLLQLPVSTSASVGMSSILETTTERST